MRRVHAQRWSVPVGLDDQIAAAVGELEHASGKQFGDPDDPLLLSVRSGAPVSMPGMLDTILNLGLTEASVEGMARRTGKAHVAWDSRRRLVQMFSEVVKGVDAMSFEELSGRRERVRGVAIDSDLDEAALRALAERFIDIYASHTGERFPEDPRISSDWRWRPSSNPGTTSAPPPTAASTAYPTTSARQSRSNGWSSGISAPAQGRGLHSPGTRPTEALERTATSSSTRRGRMSWQVFATPRTSTAWPG